MWLYNIGTLFTGNRFLENANLQVENGLVKLITQDIHQPNQNDIDCGGKVLTPGFVDCHTHLVFSGSRAHEFELRAKGASYAQIMRVGGGIRNTVRATRNSSKQELIDLAMPRLARMHARGVSTVEVKSGYGLSLDSELKMLEVIAELNKLQPAELVATFLGAHAIPPEYEADTYVQHVIKDMLPAVKAQGIATACDVFVEQGAFSVNHGRQILTAAARMGFKTRLHAEQLSHSDGAILAAELETLSASHLEYATREDAVALADAGVIAELLPVAQEYLGMKQLASGRMLTDAGVKVAIATDFNPGSAMCDNLLLAAQLGITRCGLTCEEALLGITNYGALALGRSDIGSLEVGARARCNLMSSANWVDMFYDWSVNPVEKALIF
ncbi:MAG: imidazolonepropionase [Myxococcota bacterium]